MSDIRSDVAVERTPVDRSDSAILEAQVRVPDHVVYRDFVNETVVLNLQTGTYHGLNRTAGLMLTALGSSASVRDAAAEIAEANEWDFGVVERDIVTLCRTLSESGLIELSETGA